MMNAIVLFAHGARDPAWAAPFEAVAQRLRTQLPDTEVRLAFLEFMSPDLGLAIDALASEGATRIDIVPLFLGAGGHIRRELPVLAEAARQRHPALQLRVHPPAGEHPLAIEALASVAAEAAGIPRT